MGQRTMMRGWVLLLLAAGGWAGTAGALSADPANAAQEPANGRLIALWSEGLAAFGVFVPGEGPRQRGVPPVYTEAVGASLAANPLYDFAFLNLEGNYDAAAVAAVYRGLQSGGAGRPTLLVRIPPIERDGADVAAARVREILEMGADGVVLPHIRSPEEAALAVGFFTAAGADVWSPENPAGDKIAMLMIEDPDSLARVVETADVGGYSVLACGIGSLTGALDGDRAAAEAGNQKVLAEAKRVGVADMTTANADDIARRVEEGFLGLLLQGAGADEAIRIGLRAAGR